LCFRLLSNLNEIPTIKISKSNCLNVRAQFKILRLVSQNPSCTKWLVFFLHNYIIAFAQHFHSLKHIILIAPYPTVFFFSDIYSHRHCIFNFSFSLNFIVQWFSWLFKLKKLKIVACKIGPETYESQSKGSSQQNAFSPTLHKVWVFVRLSE
jgi:hypothetical protein